MSQDPEHGSGAPWASFLSPPMTQAQIEALAHWFLLLRFPKPPPPQEPPAGEFDEPTLSTNPGIVRTRTISFAGVAALLKAQAEDSPRFVFRVKRRGHSNFDFVSLGRNDGNDIWVPDPSVSRFHAFFKELPDGTLTVQDAKSGNGTTLRDVTVPRQGEGPALRVVCGDALRVGDVFGEVVDAARLFQLLHAPR